jgi:hypothetical protein
MRHRKWHDRDTINFMEKSVNVVDNIRGRFEHPPLKTLVTKCL